MNKGKWLHPGWLDPQIRYQFPNGIYYDQHNQDDVDALVEAATETVKNVVATGGARELQLEQALKAFKEKS